MSTSGSGPFARWIKFNLVGAIGMAVQLAALALLNHALPGHYLAATAAAIEFTLLHNFTWHRFYTWRERRDLMAWPRQLAQFHLSNGIVSMLVNLVLMRVLVQNVHMSLLVGNATSILACSIINFALAEAWAFA